MFDQLGLDGFGTEGSLVAILMAGGIIFKQYVIPWVQMKRGKVPKRRASDNPGNPNGKPGRAQACIDHTTALERLGTRLDEHIKMDDKRFDDLTNEFRTQCQRIYDKIDQKRDK